MKSLGDMVQEVTKKGVLNKLEKKYKDYWNIFPEFPVLYFTMVIFISNS